jgi:hypothetical protein
VEINKPIWAVDLGDEIRALSTFDLWMGLSRGELSIEARVWRMGRECWCPIREVPELACALSPDSAASAARAEEPAERVTLDYSARREASEERELEVVEVAETAVVTVSSEAPPSAALDTSTFDAWMAEPVAPPAGPPVREPRRLVRARKIRRHLAAVAAGAAAIVLVAIGLGAPSREVAHAAERPSSPLATARPASPRTAETVQDLAAGGRVPAPRARRVSPTHAGQQRHR